VLGAAAIQGVTFAVTKAAVERAGAQGFTHLTGVWPGERRPDPE
jgi:enolase